MIAIHFHVYLISVKDRESFLGHWFEMFYGSAQVIDFDIKLPVLYKWAKIRY